MKFAISSRVPGEPNRLVPGLLSTAVLHSPDESVDLLRNHSPEAQQLFGKRWVLEGDTGLLMFQALMDDDEPVAEEISFATEGGPCLVVSQRLKNTLHRFVLPRDARCCEFLLACFQSPPLIALGNAWGTESVLMESCLPSAGFASLLSSIRQCGQQDASAQQGTRETGMAPLLFTAPTSDPMLQELSVSVSESLLLPQR